MVAVFFLRDIFTQYAIRRGFRTRAVKQLLLIKQYRRENGYLGPVQPPKYLQRGIPLHQSKDIRKPTRRQSLIFTFCSAKGTIPQGETLLRTAIGEGSMTNPNASTRERTHPLPHINNILYQLPFSCKLL
jgi:hypothetical protein